MRISFGVSSCKNYRGKNETIKLICEKINAKIDYVKSLSYGQLSSFSESESEILHFDGNEFVLTTYKDRINENKVLIVVQGFYRTLSFPNYISTKGIGKMFAEGVVIDSNEDKEDAPYNILLQYW